MQCVVCKSIKIQLIWTFTSWKHNKAQLLDGSTKHLRIGPNLLKWDFRYSLVTESAIPLTQIQGISDAISLEAIHVLFAST